MKFYDRTEGVEKLLSVVKKSTQQAQFTVIAGRRRIGKTQLLLKTFENQTFLYFFVGGHCRTTHAKTTRVRKRMRTIDNKQTWN